MYKKIPVPAGRRYGDYLILRSVYSACAASISRTADWQSSVAKI